MRIMTFLLLVSTLLLAAGCSKKEGDASKNSAIAANVAEVATVEQRAGRAPNFTWKDASGKTVSFDEFKGSVTLVNFWATWCVPCKQEIPDLIAISNELASKNIKIIGISTDRGLSVTDDVSSFVKEKGIPYQILISNDDLESSFGNIRMIPASFIIDANGMIVKELVGLHSKAAFVEAITAAVK
jgi:thiol-disulfide isomerase/thioredoxin